MKYRHLGRLGLKVSPLCLGTMNFGPQTSEADSHAIMDRALELGINFFDTANVYGQRKGVGTTETIVGQLVRQGRRSPRQGRARDEGLRRDGLVAERVAALGAPHPHGVRGQPAAAADRPHRPLPDAPRRTARRRGTRSGRRSRRSCSRARSSTSGRATSPAGTSRRRTRPRKDRHFLGLVSEQSIYNLAERTVELEVLPACEDYGIGRDPVEPALARPARRASSTAGARSGRDERRAWCRTSSRSTRPQVEAYEKFCAELGQPPADVALAWLLANPVVTAPIIGPRIARAARGCDAGAGPEARRCRR